MEEFIHRVEIHGRPFWITCWKIMVGLSLLAVITGLSQGFRVAGSVPKVGGCRENLAASRQGTMRFASDAIWDYFQQTFCKFVDGLPTLNLVL